MRLNINHLFFVALDIGKMASKKKERKVKLEVVKTEADYDPDRVLGKEMFPELYSNIYIAGRKKSGKTQLVYNILKKCANKATKVLIFSATVNKDATYKEILKMLDSKGIEHTEHEHFIDEDGVDLLSLFIEKAKEEHGEEPEEEIPKPTSRKYVPLEEARILFGNELPKAMIAKMMAEDKKEQEELEKRQAKKKKGKGKGKGKLSPEYILVFDDLGEDLRKKAVSQLLIKNRHYKCKTICLSQWITYLPPTAIRQLDYVLLFGGFNGEKLEDLHRKLDLSDSLEHFEKVYKNATAEKYRFLYISITDNSYRNGFNERLPEYSEPESA